MLIIGKDLSWKCLNGLFKLKIDSAWYLKRAASLKTDSELSKVGRIFSIKRVLIFHPSLVSTWNDSGRGSPAATFTTLRKTKLEIFIRTPYSQYQIHFLRQDDIN